MKSDNNRCFVFVYDNLCIGGIQNYMYHTIKYLKKQNQKIVIVHEPKYAIDDAYKKEFCDSGVILLRSKYYHKTLKQIANKNNINDITIITFTVPDFAKAEQFRQILPKYQMDIFYYVPNFKGAYYYLEESFEGRRKKQVQCQMTPIIRKMHEKGQIRYFSIQHREMMCKQYEYQEEEFDLVDVPTYKTNGNFNLAKRLEVHRRYEFNILSVSRFDFPHKGYLVGLIQAYGRLKNKYPQIHLTIVGYGAGLEAIRNEIDKLDANARADIKIVGKQAPEDLIAFYEDANLNISLAGCCSGGARCGTLSIPARHFTYSCEVYGYLPDSRHMITSAEPGLPVEPFVEEVINMTEKEYVQKCQEGYTILSEEVRKTSIFDRNKTLGQYIEKKEIVYILKTKKKIKRYVTIQNYIKTIRREGVILPLKRRIRRYLSR